MVVPLMALVPVAFPKVLLEAAPVPNEVEEAVDPEAIAVHSVPLYRYMLLSVVL